MLARVAVRAFFWAKKGLENPVQKVRSQDSYRHLAVRSLTHQSFPISRIVRWALELEFLIWRIETDTDWMWQVGRSHVHRIFCINSWAYKIDIFDGISLEIGMEGEGWIDRVYLFTLGSPKPLNPYFSRLWNLRRL